MSGTTPPLSVPTSPPQPQPVRGLSWRNAFASPGATWASVAAIAGVVATSLAVGYPTSTAQWLTVGISLATGVLGALSR